MRLLLVRHGQSLWNATRQLQGQADIALSATGRAEADALRDTISQIGPCRSISSDLVRVRETAQRIGAPEVDYTNQLREIDVGEWAGRPIHSLIEAERDAYLGWRAGTYTPPGGESWQRFSDRVFQVIQSEWRDRPCRNLLVVCHGGVIRALLQRLLDLQPVKLIPVAPASLSTLRLPDDHFGAARLELLNYRPGTIDLEAPD